MGITQEEMAQKLKTSRASYSLYENGKLPIDIIMLDELHSLTGLPFDYLMGYTDIKTPETVNLDSALGISKKAIDAIQGNEKIRLAIGRALEHEKMPELAESLARFNELSYALKRFQDVPEDNEAEKKLYHYRAEELETNINAEMHDIISLVDTIYTPGPDEPPYSGNIVVFRTDLEKMLDLLTEQEFRELQNLIEKLRRRNKTCHDAPTATEPNQNGTKSESNIGKK